MAVKARSEDVTADPDAVFERVRAELSEAYDIRTTARLEPYHEDHLAVVADPR
jgi:fibrillarin-like pre-rRNA processing protein